MNLDVFSVNLNDNKKTYFNKESLETQKSKAHSESRYKSLQKSIKLSGVILQALRSYESGKKHTGNVEATFCFFKSASNPSRILLHLSVGSF